MRLLAILLALLTAACGGSPFAPSPPPSKADDKVIALDPPASRDPVSVEGPEPTGLVIEGPVGDRHVRHDRD